MCLLIIRNCHDLMGKSCVCCSRGAVPWDMGWRIAGAGLVQDDMQYTWWLSVVVTMYISTSCFISRSAKTHLIQVYDKIYVVWMLIICIIRNYSVETFISGRLDYKLTESIRLQQHPTSTQPRQVSIAIPETPLILDSTINQSWSVVRKACAPIGYAAVTVMACASSHSYFTWSPAPGDFLPPSSSKLTITPYTLHLTPYTLHLTRTTGRQQWKKAFAWSLVSATVVHIPYHISAGCASELVNKILPGPEKLWIFASISIYSYMQGRGHISVVAITRQPTVTSPHSQPAEIQDGTAE